MIKTIKWIFEKHSGWWFVVPTTKKTWEKDIYIQKRNSKNAFDKDKVEIKIIKQEPWKNPEWVVLRILKDLEKKTNSKEVISWVYSSWNWNFWFVDVPWIEKWYFVHKHKSFKAQDWDLVKAYVQNYNWKKEAIIFEILENEELFAIWKFQDFESYWFVIETDFWKDIFIPWNSINDADHDDIVKVQIIKQTWKNPQWKVVEIIKENIKSNDKFEIINDFDDKI